MKLNPHYSYEYNCVLNPELSDDEQLKNFASLLSDKDRFLNMLHYIEQNSDLLEKSLGFKLDDVITFYVVRCEKFKSFSDPVTIEYSLLPEEMLLHLLREIIRSSPKKFPFPDDVLREQHVNALLDYMMINGEWGNLSLIKFCRNLHDEAKERYEGYEMIEIDFSKIRLKECIEKLY